MKTQSPEIGSGSEIEECNIPTKGYNVHTNLLCL